MAARKGVQKCCCRRRAIQRVAQVAVKRLRRVLGKVVTAVTVKDGPIVVGSGTRERWHASDSVLILAASELRDATAN